MARLVDRSLVNELQLFAVLGPDTVRPLLPAGLFQQLVGLVDVKLPMRVLRDEFWRVVDEIPGRGPGASVDVLLHRVAIDQQFQRLLDRGIAEQRVFGFGAGAFAVDFGPGVGAVDLDVFDVAARRDLGPAPGLAAILEPDQDFVLDLHIPGVIVFAGLGDGARRRYRIAAAFHLDGVKIRPVRQVIIRVAFAGDEIARLEIHEFVGAGADRLQIRRRVA